MIPVVTAIDRAYLPGLKALSNSFNANAGDGFELHCICHGDVMADVETLGVNPLAPPEWATRYPTTARWPKPLASMYSRLLIPELFEGRSIWLDADCIILQPLHELAEVEFEQPVAAVHFNNERYTLGFHVGGIEPELARVPVPFSGMLVFNGPAWRAARITNRCAEWMAHDEYDYKFVVQSVLGLALKGDYKRLPYKWQVFAGRTDPLPADTMILHYVGGLPWREPMNNQHIWDKYA